MSHADFETGRREAEQLGGITLPNKIVEAMKNSPPIAIMLWVTREEFKRFVEQREKDLSD